MPPAARITDNHVCPMVNPGPVPHVGGPVVLGSFNVFTGKLPQARVGDMLVCVGPPDAIAKGSSGVFVNKIPAARLGDQTAHGGVIVVGLPTVIIGEQGGGSGGGGGASAGLSSNGFVGGGLAALGFAQPPMQAQTLKAAALSGTPFCEVCFKLANNKLAGEHADNSPLFPFPPLPPANSFSVAGTTPAVLEKQVKNKQNWTEADIKKEWEKSERGKKILKDLPESTKFQGYDKKAGEKTNAYYSPAKNTIFIPNEYSSSEAAPTAAHEAVHAHQSVVEKRPKTRLDKVTMEVEAKNAGLDVYEQLGEPKLPYNYAAELGMRNKSQDEYDKLVIKTYKKLYNVK